MCIRDSLYPGCNWGVVAGVFPTCVGVFRTLRKRAEGVMRLPHVRGGVSSPYRRKRGGRGSSPRAWGCFLDKQRGRAQALVFPTCVGVFLVKVRPDCSGPCLPHVRGGVSEGPGKNRGFFWSSPRAWGCFLQAVFRPRRERVFPTCVGVFPSQLFWGRPNAGLPHVRGGVSFHGVFFHLVFLSSPRAWGCFCFDQFHRRASVVFPTCVGVFLKE